LAKFLNLGGQAMITPKQSSRKVGARGKLFAAVAAGAIGMLAWSSAEPAMAQFKIGDIINSAKKVAAAASFSDEEMVNYFSQMAREMDAKNPVAGPDNAYGKRLAALTKGLNNYDGLNLNIKAYLVKDVNAFAMGDGTVRVFAGMMDEFTDDEVRCVIGHEIGHVKLEHGKKRMRGALQRDAALSIAGTASRTARNLTNSQLGKMFGDVMLAQHSQKAERKADDYAVTFMKANNYNPQGCVTAMEKLAKLSAGGPSVELLRTHPKPSKRAKRMKKQIEG
jgi:putative metalloprotease